MSEVRRAGLRLIEDRDLKLNRLRAALAEGEASGVDEEFDFDLFCLKSAENLQCRVKP